MLRLSVTLILVFFYSTASANVVWPALYTETTVNSIPIIVLNLILETAVIQFLFKQGWLKSILWTITANLVSGIAGLVLRPLSGIAYELSLGMLINFLFDWGTFNPVAWFFVPVIGGALNAALELLTLKLIWKATFTKRNFYILWATNWVTVGLATLWVIKYPPAA